MLAFHCKCLPCELNKYTTSQIAEAVVAYEYASEKIKETNEND